MERNHKVIIDEAEQLQVKSFPKRKSNTRQNVEKPENELECPSWKQRNWIEFGKTYHCSNGVFVIKKPKHQLNEKILWQ